MTENSLEDVAKTLQEAILQKQNEQFKIITDSLKATLDDFSIKINSKINELESNRRTEGVERSEDPSGKRAGKRNRSVRSESPSGNRPSSENATGKRQKTNENQTDYDSSHSDESDISIHAKGNIEEDNEKNDLEKILALQEQDEDKELQHMFSEITGDKGTGPEIDSTLGEATKKVLQSELSNEKLKRYHEKYKIPSDCLYLKVPMIDSEIYQHMSKPSKAHHVKLQKHQKNIVKVSTAVVETPNTLTSIKSNKKLSLQTLTELKQKAIDTLAMLSKANNYINEMRRDDVLPQLGKDIRQIRFSIPKESKTIFGEDVSKRIASVKKMQRDIKVSSSYSSTHYYYESKKS